jgi:arsenical resistance protein ArsH
MEELVRFTILTCGHAEQLVDRYSERKSAAAVRDSENDLASQSIA